MWEKKSYSLIFGNLKFLEMANKLNNVMIMVNETMQTDKMDCQLFSNSTPMISLVTYLMIARAKTTVEPATIKIAKENKADIKIT